jgi:hypothetical protein
MAEVISPDRVGYKIAGQKTEMPRQHLLKRGRRRRSNYSEIIRTADMLRNNMRRSSPE